jgi:protein-disulfide isomerase
MPALFLERRMSRKSKRNRPDVNAEGTPAPAKVANANSRRGLIAAVLVGVLVVALAVVALRKQSAAPAPGGDAQAALASEHSPTIGDAAAKVHVVEFLDPACETGAQVYPVVKQLLADNPGKIRLSLRHVAFHDGAEFAVRALEASRAQGKYFETLEALLGSQSSWAPHHTVQSQLVVPVLERVGLDMERLRADMEGAEVTTRVERDRADAMALKVTATPEYFVNGRPLPSFGYEQLLALVREELDRAY